MSNLVAERTPNSQENRHFRQDEVGERDEIEELEKAPKTQKTKSDKAPSRARFSFFALASISSSIGEEASVHRPDMGLTLDEAAEQLRVSRRTVERLLQAGRLRGVRRGPTGGWLVTQLDLWRLLGIDAEMLSLWREILASKEASDEE